MKNMDPLNDNIATLLHQSSDKFVSELWKDGTPFAPAPCLPLAVAGLFLPFLRSRDQGRTCTRGNVMAAQNLGPRVSRPAVPPLLGSGVLFPCFCRFLLSSAWFCFNLSVAEMESTQRAYFYQRFPILHLEPGDWPP